MLADGSVKESGIMHALDEAGRGQFTGKGQLEGTYYEAGKCISLADIPYLIILKSHAEIMSSSLYFNIYTESIYSLHLIKYHSEENIHLDYRKYPVR